MHHTTWELHLHPHTSTTQRHLKGSWETHTEFSSSFHLHIVSRAGLILPEHCLHTVSWWHTFQSDSNALLCQKLCEKNDILAIGPSGSSCEVSFFEVCTCASICFLSTMIILSLSYNITVMLQPTSSTPFKRPFQSLSQHSWVFPLHTHIVHTPNKFGWKYYVYWWKTCFSHVMSAKSQTITEVSVWWASSLLPVLVQIPVFTH